MKSPQDRYNELAIEFADTDFLNMLTPVEYAEGKSMQIRAGYTKLYNDKGEEAKLAADKEAGDIVISSGLYDFVYTPESMFIILEKT